MKQLELRTYPRAEIAEVLNVRINDSGHFKRNVENKLSKWGYGFHYTTAAVEICSKPDASAERLAEILYRGFGIDIQIDPVQFACFIAAFTDIEGFSSMPWEEREMEYRKHYGFAPDVRTLRNWCSRLIGCGIIAKAGCSTQWKTFYSGGQKCRTPVCGEEEKQLQKYYQRRGELAAMHYAKELESGQAPKAAKAQAWKKAYHDLWAEFGCCYYYCKYFALSAFSTEAQIDLQEIYELVQELAAPALQSADEEPQPQPGERRFVF